MSPLIPDWLVESGLSANQIAVLAKLWRHKGKTPPFHVWPARAEILRCVRMNKDTLSAVLRDLEKAGFLKRKTTWRGGHKAVVFELLIPTGTIVRKEGMIGPDNSPILGDDWPGQSSESKGVQSSESKGVQSSESEGVQSSESKGGQSSENRGREVIQGSNTRKIERGSSPAPSCWPITIPEATLATIASDTGRSIAVIQKAWPIYRARKLRYSDDFNLEGYDGFADYLRNPKEGGRIERDVGLEAVVERSRIVATTTTTTTTEPDHWREACRWHYYGGPTFLIEDSFAFVPTYDKLSNEQRGHVQTALAAWAKLTPEERQAILDGRANATP